MMTTSHSLAQSARRMAITGCVIAMVGGRAAEVSAQRPTMREIAHFSAARATAVQAAPGIWPGFVIDTIPFRMVLPGRGTLLFGWRGKTPAGYASVDSEPATGKVGIARLVLWIAESDPGAASTATTLDSISVAQVVVTDTSLPALTGIMAHESFHAFEGSVARDSVKFGHGENSYYVSQYPVYSVRNESRFALELAVLRDALLAKTTAEARDKAREFVAVRAARHADMDPNVAEFEQMTEINEGLAEYALLRASARAEGGTPAIEADAGRMRTLLSNTNLSVRLRFYVTGSGQALLLDRIGPRDWKRQLMRRNVTLQQILAENVPAISDTARVVADAERSFDVAAMQAQAERRVQRLQVGVRNRADSLMHVPGILVVLDGSQTGIGRCRFDPQNMLQLGGGALLHTRWVTFCQHGINLEFNTPVVQSANSVKAVIRGTETGITNNGVPIPSSAFDATDMTNIQFSNASITGTIARARVTRTGDTITFVIIEP